MTASIFYKPYRYEPIHSGFGIIIGLTSTAWQSTAFKYQLEIGHYPGTTGSYTSIGRVKMPPRIDGSVAYDASSPLKTITGTNPYWGIVKGATNSLAFDSLYQPGLANKKWGFRYGWEYDPFQFALLDQFSFFTNIRVNTLTDHNLRVGDVIKLEKTNGVRNAEINGLTEVVSVLGATQALVEKSPFSSWTNDTARITYHSRLESIVNTSSDGDTLSVFEAIKDYDKLYNESVVNNITVANDPYLSNWDFTKAKRVWPYQSDSIQYFADPGNSNQQTRWTLISLYNDNTKQQLLGTFSHLTLMSSYTGTYPNNKYHVIGCGHEEISRITGYTASEINYYEIDVWGNSKFLTIKRDVDWTCYPDIRTICWINNKGGFDFFSFPKRVKEDVIIERETFNATLNYNTNMKWAGNLTGQRQINTNFVSTTDLQILKTDILSDDEWNYLRSLFTSDNIWMITGSYSYASSGLGIPILNAVPINIEDTNWMSKTNYMDDPFELEIRIRLAYDKKNFGI